MRLCFCQCVGRVPAHIINRDKVDRIIDGVLLEVSSMDCDKLQKLAMDFRCVRLWISK